MEVPWSGVNDTFAVDVCGNGCNCVGNKKITKAGTKSRVASEMPFARIRSYLLLINLIYTKNLIYRLGETFFLYTFKDSPEFFIKSYKEVQNT